MKTLQEIKEKYAIEQGYEDWEHLTNDMQPHSNIYLEQAMDEICIRSQKEALEKASENAKTKTLTIQGQDGYIHYYKVIDLTSITNPENLIR